ncbi:7471_t:CDS:10, partial [Funneliformis caledonium]
VPEVPTTVDELLPYLDPIYYTALLSNKTVPGTEGNKNACYYISTPQPEDNKGIGNQTISWSCPAGYFCLGPGKPVKCTAGFICPENSAQPMYCCPGYYCNEDATEINICPKGSFCTVGSVVPVPCHNLAYCPEGSKRANRYYVLGLFVFAAIIIAILFAVNKKANQLKTSKYKNLLNEQKMSHEKSLDPVTKTFDIEFENLGLVLPNGIAIMKGVTGKLSHGRSCAIMGPSGAGKTTFVSLLTGKAKKTSGVIKINGVKENLSKYRKLIGFVPQEDVMLRELTVREILVHSAMMRLPTDMVRAAKKQKVIETIRFLELSHVMDTIIGNEEQRGISGGQRKRVNIGMELVAEPSILFLDEPTSGLDSATSLEVCKLLKNIAHQQKLLVAAVIHSPSPQAFNTFDDFLLLGKGGRIVYFGPRENALDYFQNLGFDCPRDESPADFMMEVASCKVKPSKRETSILVDELFDAWEEYRRGGKPTLLDSDKKRPADTYINMGKETSITFGQKIKLAFLSFHIPFIHLIQDVYYYITDLLFEFIEFLRRFFLFCMKDPIRETPNVFVSFVLLFKRACLQIYRNRTQFLLDQLLHIGCGAFISLAASNFTYIGKAPIELCAITPAVIAPACLLAKDSLQSAGVFLALGVTFAGISAGGSTFGYEKVVYWRDTASGMRTIPYFLSKFIADIPRIVLAAFMFSIAFVLFYPFLSKFTELYSIVLLSYWTAWSMGYFLSALVTKEKLGLIGTGFALAWGLVFSGANPKLDEVKNGESYEYIRWLWDISTPRWAVEALYLKELYPRWWYEIHTSPLSYTYSFSDYPICMRNIVIISVSWAVAAFFAMKLTNRDKQK